MPPPHRCPPIILLPLKRRKSITNAKLWQTNGLKICDEDSCATRFVDAVPRVDESAGELSLQEWVTWDTVPAGSDGKTPPENKISDECPSPGSDYGIIPRDSQYSDSDETYSEESVEFF